MINNDESSSSVTTSRVRRRTSRASHTRRSKTLRRLVSAGLGVLLVGGGAYAATNWIVGLATGSSAQAQSATVQNLTVSAVATPSPTNLLFPGGTGDVVVTIANPNSYPVTITGFSLPANTSYATGYSNNTLTTAVSGCSSSTSLVSWTDATGSSGSAHTLTTAVTVGASGAANNPLVVTLTGDASMGSAAPAACEGTYFSMPSFTAVAASGGAATSTTTPTTDAWTS